MKTMSARTFRLDEIARLVDGTVEGRKEVVISGLARIDEAEAHELGFISSPRYARFLEQTGAGALIVSRELERTRDDIGYVVVDNPQRAFRSLLGMFAQPDDIPDFGIHRTACIGEGATIGNNTRIGPLVVIGPGCRLGDGVVVGPGVCLGRDVVVGDGTVIHANVSIYHDTWIGARCTIHSGAVIGSDGFGFEPDGDGGWVKAPQIGNVIVGDDVEIGANTTIDRATVGSTRIESGVKIDNLVHIAHNVRIGVNTVVAAQAGIAGSSRLGDRNMVAGQVGIVGHVDTTDDVIIEAGSGVSKSLKKPGRYFGHPAKEHSIALRQEGALRQLPDLLAEIRELHRRIARLEASDRLSS